jgi:hypothetical protein
LADGSAAQGLCAGQVVEDLGVPAGDLRAEGDGLTQRGQGLGDPSLPEQGPADVMLRLQGTFPAPSVRRGIAAHPADEIQDFPVGLQGLVEPARGHLEVAEALAAECLVVQERRDVGVLPGHIPDDAEGLLKGLGGVVGPADPSQVRAEVGERQGQVILVVGVARVEADEAAQASGGLLEPGLGIGVPPGIGLGDAEVAMNPSLHSAVCRVLRVRAGQLRHGIESLPKGPDRFRWLAGSHLGGGKTPIIPGQVNAVPGDPVATSHDPAPFRRWSAGEGKGHGPGAQTKRRTVPGR